MTTKIYPKNDWENEVFIREWFWQDIENNTAKYAHIIMIATKPDIIKQAPLYLELKSRWELVILVHTGQHFDYNLSLWVLSEFGMTVDINLNISGPIHKKYSLIVERLWNFLVELNEKYKKIPVPYVHWDTLTAATADKAAFLNKFAVVHVEAWIRTFTPNKDFFVDLFYNFENGKFDWNEYYRALQNLEIYERGSLEPYPEQFDTRSIEGSTGYFAAPVELYRETLIKEWFDPAKIEVVWNTVVDAIEISKKKMSSSKAFETFPNMKWKDFIFVTIHRRENCEKKERFLTLFYALKKLVQDWVPVCFLWLYASEFAIDNYGLRAELEEMKEKYKDNFAYGPALAHHAEVIDMLTKAWAVVTDSGSMQEEANIVWTPCVTLRFGSDRIETVLAWANIIAPPTNSRLIAEIIKWAIWNKEMRKENIYWTNVSEKIVNWVLKMLKGHGKLFLLDDERLGLERFVDYKI